MDFLKQLRQENAQVSSITYLRTSASAPSRFKIVERAKYDAWKKYGDLYDKEGAMRKYIEIFDSKNKSLGTKAKL